MRDPLELTQSQLEIISAAANSLPPEWHERFRSSVADELLCYGRPATNAEVGHVVSEVCAAFAAGMISDDD
jgi:hypothetical protein